MKWTRVISCGKYGGFYFYSGYTTRLCLGYFVITHYPFDLDDVL